MDLAECAKDPYVMCGVVTTAAITIAAVLDRMWYTRDDSASYQTEFGRKIKLLCQQSAQWLAIAEQDTDASIALIHYTNALAYLQAAIEFGDQASVSEHMAADAGALSERLRRKQAARLRDVFQTCPGAAPQLDVPITGWIR